MWICAKCGNENDDDSGGCRACGPTNDGGACSGRASAPQEREVGWPFTPGVGIPRRFGLDRLLALTFVLALVFGGLRWLKADSIVFAAVVVFILAIGVSQAVLYGGNQPRMASIVSGAVLAPVIWIPAMLTHHSLRPAGLSTRHLDPVDLISQVVFLFLVGGPLGYVFGGLLAGVFLIKDRDLAKVDSTATSRKEEAKTEASGRELTSEAKSK